MKTSRRKFVSDALKATVLSSIAVPAITSAASIERVKSSLGTDAFTADTPLHFEQIPLPYATDALEPNIDAMTMDIHYHKHHAAYVKNINEAIAQENISYSTPEEFFANASKLSDKARNNGGGAYNHNLFWQWMSPKGGGTPSGKVLDAINGSFGSFDAFKDQFAAAASGRFGSGWAWLVSADGKLSIGSTPNQDNPLMDLSSFRGKPLLGLDVWEHAYYLKYQNLRGTYVTNWWNVVNWDTVASML